MGHVKPGEGGADIAHSGIQVPGPQMKYVHLCTVVPFYSLQRSQCPFLILSLLIPLAFASFLHIADSPPPPNQLALSQSTYTPCSSSSGSATSYPAWVSFVCSFALEPDYIAVILPSFDLATCRGHHQMNNGNRTLGSASYQYIWSCESPASLPSLCTIFLSTLIPKCDDQSHIPAMHSLKTTTGFLNDKVSSLLWGSTACDLPPCCGSTTDAWAIPLPNSSSPALNKSLGI